MANDSDAQNDRAMSGTALDRERTGNQDREGGGHHDVDVLLCKHHELPMALPKAEDEPDHPTASHGRREMNNAHDTNDSPGRPRSGIGHGTPPDRIQAYAKLEFPFFNFYIQKLSVTIGRRPPASRQSSVPKHHTHLLKEDPESRPDGNVKLDALEPSPKLEHSQMHDEVKNETPEIDQYKPPHDDDIPAAAPARSGSASGSDGLRHNDTQHHVNELNTVTEATTSLLPCPGNKVNVDVDLGPIKAVSRDHARLFFDTTARANSRSSNGWSLEVRGRNGLVLDGKWKAKGEISRLTNRYAVCFAEELYDQAERRTTFFLDYAFPLTVQRSRSLSGYSILYCQMAFRIPLRLPPPPSKPTTTMLPPGSPPAPINIRLLPSAQLLHP